LGGDLDEVGQHRLVVQLFQHAGAGGAADEAGGDHRAAEAVQRPGHVDALAARHGAALDRAVATAEAEVRDRDGAVDRRVQRHRQDHFFCTRFPLRIRWRDRPRSNTAISIAHAATARRIRCSPIHPRALSKAPAAGIDRFATSGTVPARSPSTLTVAVPRRAPRWIGPVTLAGASTSTVVFWSARIATFSEWPTTSGNSP